MAHLLFTRLFSSRNKFAKDRSRHFEDFHPRAKLKLPHLRSRSRLSPGFFRTDEKTSEIYFTSPRQPPFRITRKSVPWLVRGGRSGNQLDPASPRRFLFERDSPVDKTIAGGIIGIIYAGFSKIHNGKGRQRCYRGKGGHFVCITKGEGPRKISRAVISPRGEGWSLSGGGWLTAYPTLPALVVKVAPIRHVARFRCQPSVQIVPLAREPSPFRIVPRERSDERMRKLPSSAPLRNPHDFEKPNFTRI